MRYGAPPFLFFAYTLELLVQIRDAVEVSVDLAMTPGQEPTELN